MLNMIRHGAETDLPPLLIAHGLFGSARNWGAIAKRLSDTRQVIAVDMRNHGHSPRSDDHSYTAMADDLAEVAATLAATPDVIGHSMGGKAAMMLALRHPNALRRLIVADIAPVSYDHTQSHIVDAMRQVDLTTVKKRSDAEAQLAGQGLERSLQSFLTQSLDIGKAEWQINLDALAAEMPAILDFPQTDAHWDGPALFLSGGASDYVRPAHRTTIKALFPGARFAKLPGAGHWLHAEDPRGFLATARVFLGA